MARQHISYGPVDRPLCVALVDGRWVPAEVRAWMQADDGSWSADVGYATRPGENRPGTFVASDLRDVDAESPPLSQHLGAVGWVSKAGTHSTRSSPRRRKVVEVSTPPVRADAAQDLEFSPADLWKRVLGARAEFRRCRQLPLGPEMSRAQLGLLVALEAYVASLAERGVPVPYALRDEVRLWRNSQEADQRMRYGAQAWVR